MVFNNIDYLVLGCFGGWGVVPGTRVVLIKEYLDDKEGRQRELTASPRSPCWEKVMVLLCTNDSIVGDLGQRNK